GGSSEIRLEPADRSSAGPAAASPPGAAAGPGETAPAATTAPPSGADGPPSDVPPDAAPASKAGSGLPPVLFVVRVLATPALGGVTVWSGIDTKNNPGPDAVRAACAGKGTSCPEYQDGLAKETRTNVLLGGAIGAAVLTGAIGAFFTNWGGGTPAKQATATA